MPKPVCVEFVLLSFLTMCESQWLLHPHSKGSLRGVCKGAIWMEPT